MTLLVDSESFYYQRKRAYLDTEKLPYDSVLLDAYIGRNMKDLFDHIIQGDVVKAKKYYENYCSYVQMHPANYREMLYPDVKEVLQSLKDDGYLLALVSCSPWQNIDAMLDQCNLKNYFDVIISGSDMIKTKPDPQMYVEAMKQLALTSSQCIVVEDSDSGIRAGAAANCKVIARRHQNQWIPEHLVSYQVNDLKELLQLLINEMNQ